MRREKRVSLEHKGPWATLANLSALSSKVASRNVISAWEVSGKVRGQLLEGKVYLYLPDFYLCLKDHVEGRYPPTLASRGIVPRKYEGISGRGIHAKEQAPSVSSEEISILKSQILSNLDASEPELDAGEVQDRLAKVELQVEALANLIILGPPSRSLGGSPSDQIAFIREAEKVSYKRALTLSDVEAWEKALSSVSIADMSAIGSAVEQLGPEASDKMRRAPMGVSILLEVSDLLHTQMQLDPRAFTLGSKEAVLKRKVAATKEELEAKVIAFSYATRALYFKTGRIPAGSLEVERSLIDTLR